MKLEFLEAGSPDCPLIRLYDFSPIEVQRLRGLIKSLIDRSRGSVVLSELPWIGSVKGCCLTLRLGDGEQGVRQTGPLIFDCTLNEVNWDNVEGLLEPFCESEPTGYQWLCRRSKVSLIVSRDGRW